MAAAATTSLPCGGNSSSEGLRGRGAEGADGGGGPGRVALWVHGPMIFSAGLDRALVPPPGGDAVGTMHGSMGRLYQSVEHIGASYLHPDARDLLLLQGGGGDSDGGEPVLAKFRLYTCTG